MVKKHSYQYFVVNLRSLVFRSVPPRCDTDSYLTLHSGVCKWDPSYDSGYGLGRPVHGNITGSL